MAAFRMPTRDLPVSTSRAILRYNGRVKTRLEDTIATEYALTIYVNGQEMATVVCTPEHLDDLVVGFLASEGVIRRLDQLQDLTVNLHAGTARVQTSTSVNFNQAFYNKRYIGSCCGKSRQSFYFYNDAHTAKRVEDRTEIHPESVLALVNRMEEMAGLFQETGAVHVASICSSDSVFQTRADIGRHNALDKLYGYAIRSGIDLNGKIVTFSGRLSSEVVLKVGKIGAPIVLAKSAPTALALDIADELNITAVGFVRGQCFNVYTHPWRIAESDMTD
ncbi:formate dehydrogenase accessory sulfurtransferase FdhD [Alicyclobacillus tolerans]|uniref:formate dehydrogenase accessory sulfurtransferase FdhD n=1 Tax=Alicyclobacillus tolerans TaxID=90970 RepID=UPI001F01F36A|nr:formate dehydrogenase accessory sulfurtransferase FdhD [Alicyclobacillus tolerans]MCF8566554.1 formate dehydrogenase accessory sulfurtransferase FdhD [Alicyclobacillus tolerans]